VGQRWGTEVSELMRRLRDGECHKMVIDHICFAVSSIHDGISYWSGIFGYEQMTDPVENTRQGVKVVFLQKEGSLPIKLIEPLEHNNSLLKFVAQGGGYHHICFKCDAIEEQIEELKAKGLRTLVAPQPGEAFNNHDIAFMRARYGLNFELIDTDERANVL
jgi:methylmalonyl-CoA/ethylmalonyl-CoA epimerase